MTESDKPDSATWNLVAHRYKYRYTDTLILVSTEVFSDGDTICFLCLIQNGYPEGCTSFCQILSPLVAHDATFTRAVLTGELYSSLI